MENDPAKETEEEHSGRKRTKREQHYKSLGRQERGFRKEKVINSVQCFRGLEG